MKTETIFTCPQCASHKLDEVMLAVIQTTEIIAVEQTAKGLACDYGGCTHDGGEVAHYQCGECGHLVAINEAELTQVLFGSG